MKERVAKELDRYWSDEPKRQKDSQKILTQENYKQFTDVLLRDTISGAIRERTSKTDTPDKILADLNQNPNYQKSIQILSTSHDTLTKQLEHLKSIIEQENKLDWKEKWRFLFFRLATGIGIAATVLATGYLAKIWEIPLPMLRIVS